MSIPKPFQMEMFPIKDDTVNKINDGIYLAKLNDDAIIEFVEDFIFEIQNDIRRWNNKQVVRTKEAYTVLAKKQRALALLDDVMEARGFATAISGIRKFRVASMLMDIFAGYQF